MMVVMEGFHHMIVGWIAGMTANTAIHIIDMILYIICLSLEDINTLFLWDDPGISFDKEKV